MLDNLTEEQVYQLNVLDEYVRFVGMEELEKITGEAKTVAKLKNVNCAPSIIIGIADHMKFQQDKIMTLEADVYNMQSHIRELTDAMNTFVMSHRSALTDIDCKMTSVKSAHGIWS